MAIIRIYMSQIFLFGLMLMTLVQSIPKQDLLVDIATLPFEKYCDFYGYPVQRHTFFTDDFY